MSTTSKRLWEKGEKTLEKVLKFTTGDDPLQDKNLVCWDALASAAHARMLLEVGLLEEKEAKDLVAALSKVFELGKEGKFDIPYELEDCHGAIEDYLVERVGDAGKKIHTGRSRNDQVLVASRLYLKHNILKILGQLSSFADIILTRLEKDAEQEMPGYTHLRQAMPTTIGMWLGSFAEWSLELTRDGLDLYEAVDSNPLGAASGFGTPLGLKRETTTELLGFARTQRNPVNIQNGRGRAELKVLNWVSEISQMMEKVSWDLILYSTTEFGFFDLPDALTTGSSIMPHKHNPDVLELIRARAARIRGAANELEWVTGKLPSNYHRDFQYTKAPVFRSVGDVRESLDLLKLAVHSFTINKEKLEATRNPALYSTYAAFRKVKEGQAFRDAYKETATDLKEGKIKVSDYSTELGEIFKETSQELDLARQEMVSLSFRISKKKDSFRKIPENVFQFKVSWSKKLFTSKT